MINPAELVDNLVAQLQGVAELVAAINNDTERIYAYHDLYPSKSSLALAIHEMPAPSIMVVWQGTGPALNSGMEVWRHQLAVYLRAGQNFAGVSYTEQPYYTMFKYIAKGLSSSGLPMNVSTIHESCLPMDTPSIQRVAGLEGLDYFEVSMAFTEIGDE